MQADVWAKHLAIARAGSIVLRALSNHAIFPVVVKGAITARRLYRDPSERDLSDLDLRVSPPQLRAIRQIGKKEGFREVLYSEPYGMLSFTVQEQLIEFEQFIGPPHFSAWSVEELRADSTRHDDIFEVPHLEPQFDDHVLLTALNVFKDKLFDSTAGSHEDLRRFARQPAWEPARLIARAKHHQLDVVIATIAHLFRADSRWNSIFEGAHWPLGVRAFARVYEKLARRFPRSLAIRLAMRAAGNPKLWRHATAAGFARALGR